MDTLNRVLGRLAVVLACTGCSSAPQAPDPDVVPPGPKVKVGIVYSAVVFTPNNAEKMANLTRTLGRAFKAAGFVFEVVGVAPPKTKADPAYLGVSMTSDPEYCFQGVVRVLNIVPDPDVHFEVRQRDGGIYGNMDDCARELVAKIMTRVTPP